MFLTMSGLIAAGFAGFAVGSIALLRLAPFHRKSKKYAFTARHISHRGGAAERIENTLGAFQHAVKNCKTDMIELDCWLTQDGHVVVSHDNNLSRVAGANLTIKKCNYKDLPRIQSSKTLLKLNPAAKNVESFDNQIPLLEAVFQEFPSVPINLDLKDDSEEIMHKVANLIYKHNRKDITVWGNFKDSVVARCGKEYPDIPLLFSAKQALYTIILFWTGLLPFVPLRGEFFEIPMPSAVAKLHPEFSSKLRFRILVRVAEFLMMRRWLFEHLQRRGIRVFIWTLNSENDYRKAIDLGADGIMTDFPTLLSEFYAKTSTQASTLNT